MRDTCKNCGGPRGLHQYETGQCPLGGTEHFPNVWTWTTYEEEDDTAARLAAAEELAEALESVMAFVDPHPNSVDNYHTPTPVTRKARTALAKWQEANNS